ncbi:MAG: response regulator [Deltaproteobacteria bacterium]|nr:response regulator [Deltaproteobacteria bacterium]
MQDPDNSGKVLTLQRRGGKNGAMQSRSAHASADVGSRVASPTESARWSEHDDPEELPEEAEATETIDFGQLFTKELTESGSFDVRYEIWSSSFGKALQAMPVPAMLINQSRVVWATNEACKRISEDYERIRGMEYSELFSHPEPKEKALGVLEDVFSKRKPRVMEGLIRFQDRRLWARMTLRSVRLMSERFVLLLVEDLTNEKKLSRQLEKRVAERTAELSRANEKLRQRERFLASIFHSIQDGISVLDSELKVVRVNPAMEKWYSHMMPIVGKKCYEAYHGRNRPCGVCPARQTLATGQSSCELIPKTGPGGENAGWLDLYTFPITDAATGQLKGVIEYVRDVTDHKRLEEELRQAVKMEAVGRLAGGVAHDFNNLLTAIMGYSSMLGSQIGKEGAGYDKLVQIKKAAQRAAQLTKQLLAFSRRQLLEMKVINLNELLQDLQAMLSRMIGEQIDLVTVLDPSAGNVKADPAQIGQLVLNLVVNARDAMPKGGTLTIETANTFVDQAYARAASEVKPGNYVMLSVTDTGHGMDAETLSRCFEPFFTSKEKGAGTGLGLATAYGIVRQHEGHISVHSEPGKGTTFRIHLPRVMEESTKDPYPSGVHEKTGGTESILLVEDEESVRDVASEALETLGYHVLQASSAEEAITISTDHPGQIDLLLADVILPKMDGRSLFSSLVASRPEMKVLYMSGYTEDYIVHHGVLDPEISFLSKPFTLDALAARVREKLDRP